MLHAKDLMIGDWAAYQGHPYQMTANDIASIADCEARGVPTDLSEIPLTSEILEKNGFTVRTAYTTPKWHIGLYGRDDSDITLNIYSEKKQEWRLSIETNRNERTVCYINNVHELQHALRLCGIEHDIIL